MWRNRVVGVKAGGRALVVAVLSLFFAAAPAARAQPVPFPLEISAGDVNGSDGTASPNGSSASATIAITPSVTTGPSGAAQTYTIEFQCSGVDTTDCGADPEITIPLDLTSDNADTPDMSGWTYSASGSLADGTSLISGQPSVIGSGTSAEYVIPLNEEALTTAAGNMSSIQITVTPPDNTTPNATTWSLTPSFQTDSIAPVAAPTAATGTATAGANISVNKSTDDGGAVYENGATVSFTIKASCGSGSTGNLYLQDGSDSVVDTLPAGLTFVSATPAPDSAPNVGDNGGTISWDASNDLPTGCTTDSTGSGTYTVVATMNVPVDQTALINAVTFTGTPIDESSTSTNARVNLIGLTTPPSAGAGTGFLSKSSVGPLNIPGSGASSADYRGTYAGHWLTNATTTPNSNPSQAEGEYSVNVNYADASGNAIQGIFETALADPMPCLDTSSGGGSTATEYDSNAVTGDISNGSFTGSSAGNDLSSLGTLCQSPAFTPTIIEVNSHDVATAVDDGWAPVAVYADGTTAALTARNGSSNYEYYTVPAANGGGSPVVAIVLLASSAIANHSLQLNVWGYASSSLQSTNVVQDTATATAYLAADGTTASGTSSQSAKLYIEPNYPQLGVYKSFSSSSIASGTTSDGVNLSGHVTVPTTGELPGDVVITDLLPTGLSWSNPVTSAQFTVSSGSGSSAKVTATVENVSDYDNTGQDLVRVTLPVAAFNASGYYTIEPPSGFVQVTVPKGAEVYNNTGDLFVQNVDDDTLPTCGPGSGGTPATFQSSDTQNLAGDGVANESYCSFAATLTVTPSGGPDYAIAKTVQGDQDSEPVGGLGIGSASEGGSATYTLTWRNTGGTELQDPVIYDILPYVGDTGVSQGQSASARDSAFATVFAGVVTSSIPSDVTVYYSTSTNPCRDEVYADSDNAGCVDDWTTTAPSDLSTVKALKFLSTGAYATLGSGTSSFSVQFNVTLPADKVNIVAWNSAATSAEDMDGDYQLATEGPKVGIEAPAPLRTPTLATAVGSAPSESGDPMADTATVGNTGGGSGSIAWQLLGPVAPNSSGTCTGLDWSGAATFGSGTKALTGDGNYTTATSTPTTPGCYSYAQQLTGSVFAGEVDSAVGAASETFLVPPPTLSTQISEPQIGAGGSVSDKTSVTHIGSAAGTLDWQLVGPVAPNSSGTCTGLDWDGAATADSGTTAVSGDGSYTTSATTLTTVGCYSYVQTLAGDIPGAPVTSSAGTTGETVLVPAAQVTVTKTASSSRVQAGQNVTYTITVTNNGTTPAYGVSFTDKPASSLQLISVSSPAGASCGGAFPLTCQLGTLAAGQQVQVKVVALPLTAGSVVNGVTVTATGAGGASVARSVSAESEVLVGLTLQKRALAKTVRAGHHVGFVITVRNPTSFTATQAQVCDRLPADLTFLRSQPRAKVRNGQFCWTFASIRAHAQKIIRVKVRALRGASGWAVNNVTLKGADIVTRRAHASVRILRWRLRSTPVTG